MEHLSKIELIGRVGTVREQIIGNERVVKFSVAVNTVYRGVAESTICTTWFNCSYSGNCVIEKGQEIHLEGTMRGQSYADENGNSRQYFEVKVQKIL